MPSTVLTVTLRTVDLMPKATRSNLKLYAFMRDPSLIGDRDRDPSHGHGHGHVGSRNSANLHVGLLQCLAFAYHAKELLTILRDP